MKSRQADQKKSPFIKKACLKKLTDEIIEAADDNIGATSLGPTSVRIKVDVPDGLGDAEAADVDGLAVRMNDVDVVGVALVQTD